MKKIKNLSTMDFSFGIHASIHSQANAKPFKNRPTKKQLHNHSAQLIKIFRSQVQTIPEDRTNPRNRRSGAFKVGAKPPVHTRSITVSQNRASFAETMNTRGRPKGAYRLQPLSVTIREERERLSRLKERAHHRGSPQRMRSGAFGSRGSISFLLLFFRECVDFFRWA